MSATTATLAFDDVMIQNFLRSYIRKSINMFPCWITSDDLLSEAWIVWSDVSNRYRDTAENRRHLMSLYMTAVERRLYKMSVSLSKKSDVSMTDIVDRDYGDEVFGVDENESMLAGIVRTPSEVRDTIESLFHFPEVMNEATHITRNGKTRRHDKNELAAKARNMNGIYTKKAERHGDELKEYLRSNT